MRGWSIRPVFYYYYYLLLLLFLLLFFFFRATVLMLCRPYTKKFGVPSLDLGHAPFFAYHYSVNKIIVIYFIVDNHHCRQRVIQFCF